jgi:hypothetical protein
MHLGPVFMIGPKSFRREICPAKAGPSPPIFAFLKFRTATKLPQFGDAVRANGLLLR